MPIWPKFEQVIDQNERRYLLHYWRYLLSWEPRAPLARGLQQGRAQKLRAIARADAIDYRIRAKQGRCILLDFKKTA